MANIKKQIVETAQKMLEDKLIAGTSGNISFFDEKTKLMYITPSNVDYKTMKPKDIVCITLDGEIKESLSNFKPSSEWKMHAEIYKNKQEVKSIIHTHSQNATAFAVVHKNIPIILVEMIPFCGGEIKCSKFALPGTAKLGEEASKALEDSYVCLLENHGVVAIGNDLKKTYLRAVYAEDAATIYLKSLQCGKPYTIPKKMQNIIFKKYKKK